MPSKVRIILLFKSILFGLKPLRILQLLKLWGKWYILIMLFFIVASFILLIAMIGAIQLTLQKETPSKKQEAFEQNARDFTKTVVKITQ